MAAREAGVQPIIGCELGLRRADAKAMAALAARIGPALPPDRWCCWCRTSAGYRNLLKLVSKSPSSRPTARRGAADRSGRARGAERGADAAYRRARSGPVGRLLAEGQAEAAEAMLLRLAALFPGRLYVELMRHGLPAEDRIEARADRARLPARPAAGRDQRRVFRRSPISTRRMTRCSASPRARLIGDPNRRRLTPEHHFKSPAEMRALFADLPEACDNTLVIARRCAFMPEAREPILPPFTTERAATRPRSCAPRRLAGLERRLEAQVFQPGDGRGASANRRRAPYRERLAFRARHHHQDGLRRLFPDRRRVHPMGEGRRASRSGRGAARARARWSPGRSPSPISIRLRFGLLFERFLNPERVSMPDFDIDFCQDRRDEVIRHVQERYGRDRVAQIITFGKLQARAVLRDVGRVLEMPYGQVDRICKLVPNNPANPVTLQQAIDGEPMLQQMRDEDETVARLMTSRSKLEGLYRHASTHAAGVVIGDRPLDELVPLYRDPRSDMPVTQFNMKYVEAGRAGEVRLPRPEDAHRAGARARPAATRAAIDARSRPSAAWTIPKTYELLAAATRWACSSSKARACATCCASCGPTASRTSSPWCALYRPGPMENIPRYIAREARPGKARIPASLARADPRGNPRHHHLPGTGDADRPGAVGLFARRRRSAAPRHGQEDQVRDGGAAPAVHRRRQGARRRRRRSPSTSSSRWRNSPATASTNRTPRPMRWSPIRPPISRPITRSSSSPPR